MAARLLVVDSGGTTRLVKPGRFFVVDSGGVTRSIQRLFVVDAGGVSRLVYQAAQLLATITVVVGNNSFLWGYNRNSDLASNFGNASGDLTFNDANAVSRTVTALYDGTDTNGTPNGDLRLVLDGVSIPDTDAVFKYIKVNGVVYQRTARGVYTADTGAANDTSWRWSNGPGTSEFGTTGGANITVEIWG